MNTCLRCQKTFEQTTGKRAMKFCGTVCRRRYYKENPKPVGKLREKQCAVCAKPFVQKKAHQRYCSETCYQGAWTRLNQKRHNKRVRNRRKAKPEWYREKEPMYYRNYRNGQIEKRPWRYCFQSRRLNARSKGMEFTLTDEWCASRWTGHCELTNIRFRQNPIGKPGPHPFSCSLDRIDSTKGYTPNNCRFILWACNAMRGLGTDADMYEVAQALIQERHQLLVSAVGICESPRPSL